MKPTSLMQLLIIAICFNLFAACDDGANSTATCGNNLLESEEACDGDQLGGNTCVILGYSGGFLMCDQDCGFDVSACESICGNGRVEAPFEECDDDNALDGDGCDLACGIEPGWICEPETGCTPVFGGIICWGANSNGQLGDGTTEDRLLPVSVVSLNTHTTNISAGGTHACAVKTDGSLWCWGNNDFGQLGNGNGVSSPIPVAVTWGM